MIRVTRRRGQDAKEVTWSAHPVYSRGVRLRRRFRRAFPGLAAAGGAASIALGAAALAAGAPACTTVDPGPNFVVPDEVYDADYFFCRVEPEVLFGRKCGSGEPGDNNGCHFNSSAVSGLAMANHPPIDCANEKVVNRAQVGAGSAAQGNLQAAQLAMSRDYKTAPLYLRATGQNHPRKIFEPTDPVVEVIKTWAQK
jgi:hypothetical protein